MFRSVYIIYDFFEGLFIVFVQIYYNIYIEVIYLVNQQIKILGSYLLMMVVYINEGYFGMIGRMFWYDEV